MWLLPRGSSSCRDSSDPKRRLLRGGTEGAEFGDWSDRPISYHAWVLPYSDHAPPSPQAHICGSLPLALGRIPRGKARVA